MRSPLSPRQQAILNRVVDTYVETAQPVGSRSITALYREIYQDSYSPATVRHEMSLLEEKGYLTHPHTSAGRMPTDQGYRYYIDYSMRPEPLREEVLTQAQNALLHQMGEMESLAEASSSILSELSEQVGIFYLRMSPEAEPRRRTHLFIRGSDHILDQPEFENRAKARLLLKALEEKMKLAEALWSQREPAGIAVSVGEENASEAFRNCSLISASLYFQGRPAGSLAVIGPTRMRYSRMVPLVSQIAQLLGNIFDKMGAES